MICEVPKSSIVNPCWIFKCPRTCSIIDFGTRYVLTVAERNTEVNAAIENPQSASIYCNDKLILSPPRPLILGKEAEVAGMFLVRS